jgi:ribosomal protein S8
MQTYKRNGNKWSVNELLQLQREYELLELSIQDIAVKHQRTVQSILYKLEAEGFIESWNEARGLNEWRSENKYDESQDEDNEDEEQLTENNNDDATDAISEIDDLTERVWSLETSVGEIRTMVKQMFDKMVETKTNTKKRRKLRTY